MSDVILYAALKENHRMMREKIDGGGASAFDYSQQAPKGYPYTSGGGGGGGDEFSSCPSIVQNWVANLCPLLKTDYTNSFKVCDTSGNYRCGNNCTWCVPPGVCNVQFQLWGPGGGTSGSCCCGGSPHGPSGAYMVIQMDVTPGECYCLCAGCAYCCWASTTTPGICGNPTFIRNQVNGFCACADSGISCMNHWADDIYAPYGGDGSCGIPALDGCSANACYGQWGFCYDSGQDGVEICHAFASRTSFWVKNTGGKNVTYYGLNGLWPALCIGNNNASPNCLHGSCTITTPVFGFEACVCGSRFTSSDSGEAYGGCYYSAAQGYQQIPSVGGYHTYFCGGENSRDGDSGGMGMICVQWCCG